MPQQSPNPKASILRSEYTLTVDQLDAIIEEHCGRVLEGAVVGAELDDQVIVIFPDVHISTPGWEKRGEIMVRSGRDIGETLRGESNLIAFRRALRPFIRVA